MEKDHVLTVDRDDSRLRILCLYRILQELTDESHALSTREIIEIMETKYGIAMHRTTLPKDIEVLRMAGIEVMTERKQSMLYYLSDRPFSMPELRLLIDAVSSSKFLTERKSQEMISKLISLTSSMNADKLKRTIHVTGKAKSENEKGYYIVDTINEAINLGRKISFYYFDFDVNKQQVLRNGGAPYTVSPYDLIWDGDFYYLTGYCDERKEVRTFRVDRIEKSPEMLKAASVPKGENYRVERYTQEVFRMYATQQVEQVQLLCEESIMKAVIDVFGPGVRTVPAGGTKFIATVKVCISPNFFRWVFGWEGQILILEPASVQEQYKNMMQRELDLY